MFRTFVLLAGGLASLWTVSTQAQEAVLGQLYGKGVHAYFSDDYGKAYECLSAAINAGSRDPRAFYFRGLAYLKLGRTPEAEMDFRKGAGLESKDINKYYDVGHAIQRVQGSQRQLLESYRVQARLAALEESERLRKARYEAIKREEARVLQSQAKEGAAGQANEPSETIPAPAGEATATEAVPDTGATPAGVPEEEKPVEEKGAKADVVTGAEPAAEDPFAEKEKPAAEKEAEKQPAAAEEKPAAEAKPATGKSIFKALGKSLTNGVTGGGNKVPAPGTENPFANKATEEEKPAAKEKAVTGESIWTPSQPTQPTQPIPPTKPLPPIKATPPLNYVPVTPPQRPTQR